MSRAVGRYARRRRIGPISQSEWLRHFVRPLLAVASLPFKANSYVRESHLSDTGSDVRARDGDEPVADLADDRLGLSPRSWIQVGEIGQQNALCQIRPAATPLPKATSGATPLAGTSKGLARHELRNSATIPRNCLRWLAAARVNISRGQAKRLSKDINHAGQPCATAALGGPHTHGAPISASADPTILQGRVQAIAANEFLRRGSSPVPPAARRRAPAGWRRSGRHGQTLGRPDDHRARRAIGRTSRVRGPLARSGLAGDAAAHPCPRP